MLIEPETSLHQNSQLAKLQGQQQTNVSMSLDMAVLNCNTELTCLSIGTISSHVLRLTLSAASWTPPYTVKGVCLQCKTTGSLTMGYSLVRRSHEMLEHMNNSC